MQHKPFSRFPSPAGKPEIEKCFIAILLKPTMPQSSVKDAFASSFSFALRRGKKKSINDQNHKAREYKRVIIHQGKIYIFSTNIKWLMFSDLFDQSRASSCVVFGVNVGLCFCLVGANGFFLSVYRHVFESLYIGCGIQRATAGVQNNHRNTNVYKIDK